MTTFPYVTITTPYTPGYSNSYTPGNSNYYTPGYSNYPPKFPNILKKNASLTLMESPYEYAIRKEIERLTKRLKEYQNPFHMLYGAN